MAVSVTINPYYIGDLLQGTMSLRMADPLNPAKQDAYMLPAGASISIYLPGATASVVLSSLTPLPIEFGIGNEITVVSATATDITFTMIPSKGQGIKVGTAQPVNAVVYDSMGSQLQTFQAGNYITAVVPANSP